MAAVVRHRGVVTIPARHKGAQTASRTNAGRNAPDGRPVVVGVADHNGWTVLVSAAAVNGEPRVVDRRRVTLVDKGVPSQPYHHETLGLGDRDAERLILQVKQSIAARTAEAFDRLSADLSPQYRVSSITIRHPPLAHLPATVREVHASYHVLCRADGMLYYNAICDEARRLGWQLVLHRRGEEPARAAEALRTTTDEVDRFMADLRRTLKPPWTTEHRHAFAAAIASLKGHSKLRRLGSGTIADNRG